MLTTTITITTITIGQRRRLMPPQVFNPFFHAFAAFPARLWCNCLPTSLYIVHRLKKTAKTRIPIILFIYTMISVNVWKIIFRLFFFFDFLFFILYYIIFQLLYLSLIIRIHCQFYLFVRKRERERKKERERERNRTTIKIRFKMIGKMKIQRILHFFTSMFFCK